MKNNEISVLGLFFVTLVSFCTTVFSGNSENTPEENKVQSINYGLSESYNSFSEEAGWLRKLWGEPFRNHFYAGMWTHHFHSRKGQENVNKLFALTYRGYYAGTFINTQRDRVYSAGWQRTLYRDKWGVFDAEAGYRAGMMYGYTQYLTLGDTRWFPLLQTILDVDYKGFGMEFSWAAVVLTAGFYYRF